MTQKTLRLVILLNSILFFSEVPAQDIYRKSLYEYQKMPKSEKRDSAIIHLLFSLSKLRQPGENWDEKLKKFATENHSKAGNILWKLKYVEKEITNLNYDKGVDSLIKIGKALEKLNHKSYASFAYLRAGIVYVYSSDGFLNRRNALPYYQKALALATESKDITEIIRANDYIGELFYEMGDLKSAISYLKKAQELIEYNGDKYMYPSIAASLSSAYFQLGKKDLSKTYLKKANYWLYNSDLKFDNLYKTYINYIYQKGVATFYLKNKQYNEAILHANQGLFAIEEALKLRKTRISKFDNYSIDLLKILHISHSQKSEYALAYKYLSEFNEKQTTHQKRELNTVFQELNQKYQTEQKQQEINRLTIEKTQIKLQNQQIYGYLLLGLALLLALGLGYFVWSNKMLKIKNKEISEAMLKGQTTERQRVAADLHDNLGSTLSSIQWSLQAIDKSKMDTSELEVQQNLSKMLEKAYNDVRFLSHNLLPEEFEKQGLVASLKYFVRKINQNSSIKFDLNINENLGRLDNKVEFELYSICLELVTNITKHSKATEAKISLEKFKNQIQLIVEDNGTGIFENNSDGKGMKNVRARVESLNGTWNLQNTANQGVRSEITIFV